MVGVTTRSFSLEGKQREGENIIEPNIYCVGDCLTAGVGNGGVVAMAYPDQVYEKLKRKYNVYNYGRTMATADMIAKFSHKFALEWVRAGDIVFYWCGTNDLYRNELPETVFVIFDQYCQLVIQKKAIIVPLTLIPRVAPTVPVNFERSRRRFNYLLRSKYEFVVDVGRNKRIGYLGAQENKEYYCYPDTTHLSPKGYEIVASLVARKVRTILKGQN